MTSPFDAMNYPNTMTWVHVTPGYHNSTTGVWVPESMTTPVTFTGHLSSVTDKERQFLPQAAIDAGVRLLATESMGIVDGDRIQITEYDSSTTMWYVLKEVSTSSVMRNILGITRRQFYLVRQK